MIRKFILLLLIALPLSAQDEAFFIERIEVRNHDRVSPDVVIAESRLREGRAYSEAELRDASTRLGRLPFLLSVDFALEKGSERGNYVLVLTLQETRTFFFLADLQPHFDGQDAESVIPDDESRGATSENLALGFRWFVGRRGALHIAFSGGDRRREFAREYAAFSVGYTQYDLFGTRAFATLNLRKIVDFEDTGISPQLVVGVPLSANQTLTLQYDELQARRDGLFSILRSYDETYSQRLISARLSYNTTNEPFFPTRGVHLYGGPIAGWTDGEVDYRDEPYTPYAFHSRFYGIEGGAARYFELTDRDSVWGDVRGEWSSNERSASNVPPDGVIPDENVVYGSVGIGYSHSLWSREQRANGDSRFEMTARYANRDRWIDSDPHDAGWRDNEVFQIGGAWVRRTSFGTLRLGVGYAW
ncbi:MAG TPA: hypothetical protein VEO54_28605 [Thermoanaerobaculia bacterium]|nr:hypothetical protein [Thermoanaerobaculia bacterium]